MDAASRKEVYKELLRENESVLPVLQRRHLIIAVFRLFVFIGGIILSAFAFTRSVIPGITCSVVIAGIFLYLVKIYDSLSQKIALIQNIIKINQSEIKALDGDYSDFDGGSDFIDPGHDFSADIDLFGENSLFRFLNRTVTGAGRECLANWLSEPYLFKDSIIERQTAVRELSGMIAWRQQFLAHGLDKALSRAEIQSLTEWLNEKDSFFSSGFLRVTARLMPVATILMLVLVITGKVPYSFFLFLFFINLLLVGYFIRKTNRIHDRISRKHLILSSYTQLIEAIESEHFSSAILVEAREKICGREHSASVEIRKLNSIIKAFDSRLNFIAGFVLNGLVLWDFQCIIRLEKWRSSGASSLPVWLNSIGDIDAFISFANYAYNNPAYAFPEPVGNSVMIDAVSLGHPLLNEESRVTNDFIVPHPGKIFVITGANMAGKSTFLRTVAVNLILAMAGAPVCASSMRFTTVRLFTSMRTTDSLSSHESYFYAELKRLKMLKIRLEAGERIFFILDEILKGTNSTDKSLGSKQFLQKMIGLGGTGMIATHDISLGALEKEFPDRIINKCFEIEIDGENISFDYLLRDGITVRMNAAVLMKQMGIV